MKFKLGNVHKLRLIKRLNGEDVIVQELELRKRKFDEFSKSLKEQNINLDYIIFQEAEKAFLQANKWLEDMIHRLNKKAVDKRLVEEESNYLIKKGDIHYDGEKLSELKSTPKIYFNDGFIWMYFNLNFTIELSEELNNGVDTLHYEGLVKPCDEIVFDEDFIKAAYIFRKKRGNIFVESNYENIFKNVVDSSDIESLIDSYFGTHWKASEIGKLCSEPHLQSEKSHRFTQNIRQWITRGHFESKGKEGREHLVDVSEVLDYLCKSNNQNNFTSLKNFFYNTKGIHIPV